MIKYILKRLGLGLLTLFILIVITFTLTKVMPGSPLQSKNISGDVLAKMEAQYGLDKPVVTQLFIYINNMLHGNLGTSYKKTGTSVTSIIKQSMIPKAWSCYYSSCSGSWNLFWHHDGKIKEPGCKGSLAYRTYTWS